MKVLVVWTVLALFVFIGDSAVYRHPGYKEPTDPLFSDTPVSYEELDSKEYFSDKEYPALRNELQLYRMKAPGGFLGPHERYEYQKRPTTEAPFVPDNQRPADPLFSDTPVSYEELDSKEYFSDKDYPAIRNELNLYRMKAPGGFLGQNERYVYEKRPTTEAPFVPDNQRPADPLTSEDSTEYDDPDDANYYHDAEYPMLPNEQRVYNRAPKTSNRDQPKNQPNSQPRGQPNVQPHVQPATKAPTNTMTDSSGKPIAALNRANLFVVVGQINGCTPFASRSVLHRGTESTSKFESPRVNGVTVELPPVASTTLRVVLMRRGAENIMTIHTTATYHPSYATVKWYDCA